MRSVLGHYNWKILLMALVVNMISIAFTALVLPGVTILERPFLTLVLLAVGLGLLNTFVKPILQVLTIRLFFVTYGLVLIVTNTLLLWFLDLLFPNTFEVKGLLTAIIGGIMIGAISMFLDYLLGVTPPVGYEQAVQEGEAVL